MQVEILSSVTSEVPPVGRDLKEPQNHKSLRFTYVITTESFFKLIRTKSLSSL